MSLMKKWITAGVLGLIGWTSFYDLTHGTLPLILKPTVSAAQSPSKAQAKAPAKTQSSSSTKKVVVQPGDTVLSIEEKLNGDHIHPIAQVLQDFKKLNPSVDPNHIQIGKTYVFKIY